MTNRIARFAALGLVAVFAAACAESSPTQVTEAPVSEGRFDNMGNKPAAMQPTIVDIAAGNPAFSLLVEAVQTAGLVEALSGKGQFTVFAPTNDAFVALLGELGVSKDDVFGDLDLLTAVLLYHVVPGRRYAEDVLGSEQLRTLGGGFFYQAGGVITDARGREANFVDDGQGGLLIDIEASNGVIHVIDTVILP